MHVGLDIRKWQLVPRKVSEFGNENQKTNVEETPEFRKNQQLLLAILIHFVFATQRNWSLSRKMF